MMSFAHGIATRNYTTVAIFHVTAEIRLDFDAVYFVVAIDGIDLAIVKQNRQVMDGASEIIVSPWSFRLVRYKNLHSDSVDIREYIELAVMITDAWSPDSLAVCLFAVFESEAVVVNVNPVESVAAEVPVDKVLGFQDYEAGIAMHGRAGQIERVAHSDQIRV